MNIPKEDFLELINLYLDNEASPKDLNKIAKLIEENEEFAAMFYEYRSISIATAQYYHKKVVLQVLPKVKARRPSVFFGNLEWCMIIALVLACVFFFKGSMRSGTDKYINSFAMDTGSEEASLTMKVKDFFVETYSVYSLIEFNNN